MEAPYFYGLVYYAHKDGPRPAAWQCLDARQERASQHERLMTAGTDKTQEVGGGEPGGGGGVLERMAIDLDKWNESRIHHRGHASVAIVDQGKWRDRTWRHAEQFGEELGIAEAQPPELEVRCQELEIDASIVLGDHKSCAPFFVGQEQILGMSTRQLSRNVCDCSTVNIGSCSTVVEAMPSSARRSNKVLRSAVTKPKFTRTVSTKYLILRNSDAVKACGTPYRQRRGDQLQGPTVPSSANRMVLARARE